MFAKSTKQINIKDYKLLGIHSQFGMVIDGNFKGVRYNVTEPYEFREFLDLIPKRYQSDFYLSVMVINHEIPPHTDSGIRAVVNLYLETGNCSTVFYDIASDAPKLTQVDNQTNGHIYDVSDLHERGFFVALSGETWVLDVTRPHSVIPRGKMGNRIVASLTTNSHDFNDVILMLRETGSI